MIDKRGFLRTAIYIVLIALVIEVFVFNYRCFESLFFKSTTGYSVDYYGMGGKGSSVFEVKDGDNTFIEINNIDSEIKNIWIDIYNVNNSVAGSAIPIKVYAKDLANSNYTGLQDTEVLHSIVESQFVRLHLIGKSESVRIKLGVSTGDCLQLDGIGVNMHRPFVFKIWRVVLIYILLMLGYLFRPSSVLYKKNLHIKSFKQKILIVSFCIANVLLIVTIGLVFRDDNWINTGWKANLQYNYVAESLLEGHTYLNIEPPSVLEEIENPYDYNLRTNALNENGQSVIMDIAYYNGRHYSYFGIVPVIIFYLPYHLISGKYLDTALPILFLAALFVIVAYCFIYRIIDRFFKSTSLGLYLLLTSVFIAASQVLYTVQHIAIYELPILMGLTLDLMGITLWMSAVNDEEKISKIHLVLGALCIALVIGCRPQLAIAVLFAFPIFWKEIKERKFFSIKGLGNTLCVIIPFLIVGIGILSYNYARFQNALDFGATYNLTGFDMTHKGFIPDRFILGFYEYFFQPINVSAKYPFIYPVAKHMNLQADYMGQIINESVYGGFFAYNIIAFYLFRINKLREDKGSRVLFMFSVVSIVSALVIVGLDIQMVGMTQRYLSDFSMFLMMPVVFIILRIMKIDDSTSFDKNYKNKLAFIIALSVFCIAINYVALIGAEKSNGLFYVNPYIFYKIKYQLCSFLSIR